MKQRRRIVDPTRVRDGAGRVPPRGALSQAALVLCMHVWLHSRVHKDISLCRHGPQNTATERVAIPMTLGSCAA